MDTQDNWIKTEDELPALGQRFNAVIHNKVTYDCGAYEGHWSDDDRRRTMLIKGITHWQPLLKLPAEKMACHPERPLLHNYEGNWTDDFSHENGNYVNTCVICDHNFLGHKRRIVCKKCVDKSDINPF